MNKSTAQPTITTATGLTMIQVTISNVFVQFWKDPMSGDNSVKLVVSMLNTVLHTMSTVTGLERCQLQEEVVLREAHQKNVTLVNNMMKHVSLMKALLLDKTIGNSTRVGCSLLDTVHPTVPELGWQEDITIGERALMLSQASGGGGQMTSHLILTSESNLKLTPLTLGIMNGF